MQIALNIEKKMLNLRSKHENVNSKEIYFFPHIELATIQQTDSAGYGWP